MTSVTDTDIMDAVVACCGTLKNDFVPDRTAMFDKQLKMDLSIDDCDTRIFRYFEDFNGIIVDNGLRHLIGTDNVSEDGYKDRMKARCHLLVENLQPPVLKAQIVRLIDLEKYKCKTDDVALYDLILEHAKVQQRFHRISQDYAVRGDSNTAPSPAPAPSTQAPQPPRSPPHDGCLHCKRPHWLKDCPTATVAQQAEARGKFQEAKKKRSSALRSKAAKYATPSGSVQINGIIEVVYIPDSGADKSIIPQGVVESLLAVQPLLSSTLLSTNMEVVMADGRQLVCDQEVLLDLELMTIAGPVSIRSVPCLVLSGGGDEVLLGRDVLKGLGIDVEEQLAQLAGPLSLDRDMDEFPAGDGIPDPQDAQEPITTLSQLLDRAVVNGLPTKHVDTVRDVLELIPDVWRAAVGPDPPAKVGPLRVTLKPDAVPYRSPLRKYGPLQAQYIREYVKSLVDNGLVEQNNASRWACAVVPVRKPGTSDKFRLTIDYRLINSMTVPIAGTMPTAATTNESFHDKKVFASFDFTQGFWQLPLDEESREVFSSFTPDDVYTPARAPQGAMDSALHFQSQVQTKLAPLIPHSALVWVDDVILFAATVPGFLETLKVFFEIVKEANFKLTMAKSSLFKLEIKWCDRLISCEGVRHDPVRVSALASLPLSATVADLQYFVCATNRLHDSLPDYARVIAPLQDKHNAERKRLGRRNRNALNVATTWSTAERSAYDAVLSLVRDSALMASPDPDAELLVFTDAILTRYSIVVTKIANWDPTIPVTE
ncbi:hypothetical protein PC123_g25147 [Phytophthora cactorum]|nr:hypothetical protein PC123_g25147 [Phytophthora cactorum]